MFRKTILPRSFLQEASVAPKATTRMVDVEARATVLPAAFLDEASISPVRTERLLDVAFRRTILPRDFIDPEVIGFDRTVFVRPVGTGIGWGRNWSLIWGR